MITVPRRGRIGTRNARCIRLAVVLLFGCADATSPGFVHEAGLIVQADLSNTAASALVLEVTAPDIPSRLIFNLPIEQRLARGTLILPAGSDRLLTARAFDVRGAETHRGERLLQVLVGSNHVVGFTLLPLQGQQPIEITVGSYRISVLPGAAILATNETVQLEASVHDADLEVVAGAAVQWASLDPTIAAVSAAGEVTAHASGTTQVVAIYAGAAAAALITVQLP